MKLRCPPRTSCNLTNRRAAHAERLSDIVMLGTYPDQRTDTYNGISGQLGETMRLTLRCPGASLPASVRHVIGGSAQEQMRRVHAWRVVAMMKHEHFAGDRPERSHPCETVRHYVPMIGAREIHRSVSFPAYRGAKFSAMPFDALTVTVRSGIETCPEISVEIGRDRDMLTYSHVDLRSGSQVRPGETLARLPGRSYFTRGAA